MKLRYINFISTAVLVLLTLSLLAIVNLGGARLASIQQSTKQLLDLKSFITIDIRGVIESYLRSGDSVLLAEAESQLLLLLNGKLAGLPKEQKQAITNQAKIIKHLLAVDLRAAGKLSDNPHTLLIHAESEILSVLDSMADYAVEGTANNPAIARDYLTRIGEMSRTLHRLTQVRQRYYLTRDGLQKENMELIIQELLRESEVVSELPLLGVVVEQESDDVADLLWGNDEEKKTALEDRGSGLADELGSLLRRYPNEMVRTEQWTGQNQALQQQVRDEVAVLQQRVNKLVADFQQRQAGIQGEVNLMLVSAVVLMIVIALAAGVIMHYIVQALGKAVSGLAKMREGDFTSTPIIKSSIEELVSLLESTQYLRTALNEMLIEIRENSFSIRDASIGVNDSANKVNELTTSQKDQAIQATVAVEQISESVKQVAARTNEVNEITRQADAELGDGMKNINKTLGSIEQLGQEIEKTGQALLSLKDNADGINGFVEVIQAIAEQTNLLALNAAIEAARAGERGRGFAVVADEVRGLAQRTNEATKEIHLLVEKVTGASSNLAEALDSQKESNQQTVGFAQVAGESYRRVVKNVTHIRDSMERINQQAEFLSTGTDQVSRVINDVAESSQSTQSESASSISYSENLASISQRFAGLTDGYQVDESFSKAGNTKV